MKINKKVNKMSRARYNSREKKSRMKHKKKTNRMKNTINNIRRYNTKLKGGSVNAATPTKRFSIKLPNDSERTIIRRLQENKSKIESEIESLNFKMRLKNFELFEVTSSFVQLRYFYEEGKVPLYFTINTSDLSVDTLQYFINNNKLRITDDNYISIDENTINIKGYKTAGQKRTGGGNEESNKFLDVYEDETMDMISYEESLENLGCSNKENNKENNKGHIFEINLKNLKNDKVCKLVEDVSWLKEITNDLNSIFEIDSYKGKKIDYFLEQVKLGTITKDTKIFKCIDLNVDHTKLIIDDGNDGDNKLLIDGEEYVIIGYPAEKMRAYLDLYNKHQTDFNTIYG